MKNNLVLLAIAIAVLFSASAQADIEIMPDPIAPVDVKTVNIDATIKMGSDAVNQTVEVINPNPNAMGDLIATAASHVGNINIEDMPTGDTINVTGAIESISTGPVVQTVSVDSLNINPLSVGATAAHNVNSIKIGPK